MIRALLRRLGVQIHKGWKYGRHGCSKECVGCGERRERYMAWVTPSMPDWWETTKSGDGSCGDIPELPRRLEIS
jgi:hypothetical protein